MAVGRVRSLSLRTSMTNTSYRPEPGSWNTRTRGMVVLSLPRRTPWLESGEEVTKFKERDSMVRHSRRSVITRRYSPVRFLDSYVPSALEFSSTLPIVYCPISFNSDKILEISTFEKSQKIWKIEKELNPGSEKIGCDVGRPNWMKSDSMLASAYMVTHRLCVFKRYVSTHLHILFLLS